MANDWIKWVKGLVHRREVIAVAKKLNLDRRITACSCMLLWEWCDDNTVDGHIGGVGASDLDLVVGLPGFSEALQEQGWLRFTAKGVTVVRWERHNGESAKKRAKNTMLKAVRRAAIKAGGDGSTRRECIPAKVKRAVRERDGKWCRYCGWDVSKEAPPYGNYFGVVASYDHVIPVVAGGDNSTDNIVLCCSKCNQQKNGRTPEEWGTPLMPPPKQRLQNVTQPSDVSVTREEREREREVPQGISQGKALEPDSRSLSPPTHADVSRAAGRMHWMAAMCKLFSRDVKQGLSDKTSAERMFDDLIWPDYDDDVKACSDRYRKALDIVKRSTGRANRMAWVTKVLNEEIA